MCVFIITDIKSFCHFDFWDLCVFVCGAVNSSLLNVLFSVFSAVCLFLDATILTEKDILKVH